MIAPPRLTRRTYSSRTFAIEIEGHQPGFLKTLEGGNLKAPIVTDKAGADHHVFKSVGQPEYDDISFQIGIVQSPPVNDWIKDSFDKQHSRRSGALLGCDSKFKEVSRRTFTNAVITEVGFPALDANSKEAGYLTVKCKPERIEYEQGNFHVVRGVYPENQKFWSPANFRLDIRGLDCSDITKIDAMVLKQSATRHETGDERDATVEPTQLETPNLVVYVPESHARSWIAWAQDFIQKGKTELEKTGTLEFLTPNVKNVLGSLKFSNLGIFSLGYEKHD